MLALETPRLILRPFDRADLDELAAIRADPEVMRFSLRGAETRAQTADMLDGIIHSYAKGYGLRAVIDRTSQQLIGICGLIHQVIDQQPEIEIGYRFARAVWGRGFATEAAQAVRDDGFERLGVDRLICIIEAANHRSIRVATKVGMRYEKDAVFYGIPVQVYAMASPKIAS